MVRVTRPRRCARPSARCGNTAGRMAVRRSHIRSTGPGSRWWERGEGMERDWGRRSAARLWAAPGTLIGLALLVLARATGGVVRRHAGTLEAHGGAIARVLQWI